jgi:hypothetical protein
MVCDTIEFCRLLPKFQGNISAPSLDTSTLKMGVLCSLFGNHLQDYLASQPRRPE